LIYEAISAGSPPASSVLRHRLRNRETSSKPSVASEYQDLLI
jgi:hypothetical protein